MKPAAALLLVVPLLSGCAMPNPDDCWREATPELGDWRPPTQASPKVVDLSAAYQSKGYRGLDPAGTDPSKWPDLDGETVTILDHGAFTWLFSAAKPLFENLTGGRVEHIEAQDAGGMLERAILEKGQPSADVLYGLDNTLLPRAVEAGVLAPYRPLLAPRIEPAYLFADPNAPWLATPMDHSYIAVNADPRDTAAAGVSTLADLVPVAGRFVTEDPRLSSPGLGFLVATVAAFGEDCYLGYWRDLLAGGALVTPDWTTAYATHFSGGMQSAPPPGALGDRSIVVSYTTSPPYELFYGGTTENRNVLAPGATFHQIETMALLKDARHPAAAQAWIEFTLTDAFQGLIAANNAMYPVVGGIDVSSTYGGKDPAPGSFQDAGFDAATLAAKAPEWVRAWTEVYEASKA